VKPKGSDVTSMGEMESGTKFLVEETQGKKRRGREGITLESIYANRI
jgi:hypothetical protein